MTTKKKNDLQEAYNQLRDQFVLLKREIESIRAKNDEKLAELTEPAFSIFVDENKEYKLVELKYNPLTKEAQVVSIVDAARNNKVFALANMTLAEKNATIVMDRASQKAAK